MSPSPTEHSGQDGAGNAPRVSIVILTCNEERNIADCLDSVAGYGDVHVLDSGSTDGTLDIAANRGAVIHRHPFTGFGDQRNWAIDHIAAAHEWVFFLDADERMTPALSREIAAALAGQPTLAGYHVPSQFIFAGRWLRHAAQYPTYQVRLFHRQRLRFVNYGHGQREVTDLPLGRLREPYLHLALSKGLDDWFAKHARYARLEAEEAMRDRSGEVVGERPRLLSADPTLRRRALKRLAYRLPCRATFRFLYMILIKRAILDGRPGIIYSRMMATYESMTAVHLALLRRRLKP